MVQAHRTSSNLLELHPHRDSKVYRVLLHEFGVVQAHRTSSNLLELHSHRDSKVYRVLLHEFGVVRLDRTFSDYIFSTLSTSLQGKQGVQGAYAICTGSGRFKHIEPHRTFSNYILTEIARYIEFFYTSSGWFDWTEPSATTSLQGIQGVQGAICTGSGRFKHIEPHRTFSNYTITPCNGILLDGCQPMMQTTSTQSCITPFNTYQGLETYTVCLSLCLKSMHTLSLSET